MSFPSTPPMRSAGLSINFDPGQKTIYSPQQHGERSPLASGPAFAAGSRNSRNNQGADRSFYPSSALRMPHGPPMVTVTPIKQPPTNPGAFPSMTGQDPNVHSNPLSRKFRTHTPTGGMIGGGGSRQGQRHHFSQSPPMVSRKIVNDLDFAAYPPSSATSSPSPTLSWADRLKQSTGMTRTASWGHLHHQQPPSSQGQMILENLVASTYTGPGSPELCRSPSPRSRSHTRAPIASILDSRSSSRGHTSQIRLSSPMRKVNSPRPTNSPRAFFSGAKKFFGGFSSSKTRLVAHKDHGGGNHDSYASLSHMSYPHVLEASTTASSLTTGHGTTARTRSTTLTSSSSMPEPESTESMLELELESTREVLPGYQWNQDDDSVKTQQFGRGQTEVLCPGYQWNQDDNSVNMQRGRGETRIYSDKSTWNDVPMVSVEVLPNDRIGRQRSESLNSDSGDILSTYPRRRSHSCTRHRRATWAGCNDKQLYTLKAVEQFAEDLASLVTEDCELIRKTHAENVEKLRLFNEKLRLQVLEIANKFGDNKTFPWNKTEEEGGTNNQNPSIPEILLFFDI